MKRYVIECKDTKTASYVCFNVVPKKYKNYKYVCTENNNVVIYFEK